MIKFYYDLSTHQFLTKEAGSEVWVQGDADAKTIELYFGHMASGSFVNDLTSTTVYDYNCDLIVQRPDDAIGTTGTFYTSPNAGAYYTLVIGSWICEQDGTLDLYAQLRTSSATTAFGVATQEVGEGSPGTATTITTAQYDSLLLTIANMDAERAAVIAYLLSTFGYVAAQTAAEYMQLNISTSETADAVGKFVWSADYKTIEMAMSSTHIYRFGEQLVVYVLNKTGATLTKGTPVYVYGEFASSGKVLVDKLSYAPADYPKALKIAGVMAEDVANNAQGFVTFRGEVNGLDLSAYSVGDNLYIGSTAGTLTNVVPTSPNIKAAIGMVINNSATEGTLLVSRSVHHNLSNLSDVLISSASNLDVLAYDSVNARWRNYDLMSYLASSYLALDGSNSMGANLNMASHKIVNVTDGSDPGDAVNKDQFDTALANKADLVGGLVPSSQLPSYVDDVLEYATYADLPATGEAGKIYVVIADETSGGNTSTYRWATSVYIQVSDTLSAAEAKTLYESNADTNAFTDAEKTKLGTLLSGTYYYSAAEIDALLDSLKTVYGLTETVIDTLAHNGTVALADLVEYDFLTIYLKHTETSILIFDGKLIDPNQFANNGDFIQINAFDAGIQRSYGKLTYDGSTNLTFTASDTADTLVIHGYKSGSIQSGVFATETIEIDPGDWSSSTCTKSSSYVTATNIVILGPAPDDMDNYLNAEIKCTAQGAGTLTFTCVTTPTASITVNVIVGGL